MKYIYPLEPNADITEGLDDRVVDMLLNHRDKINEVVEVIDSYFNIEEPESRLTSKEVQQIEMADDLREILRPYHKEGESYITTLKELLSSPEKKDKKDLLCVADDLVYTSNPPKYRCRYCLNWWTPSREDTPVCTRNKPKSPEKKEEPTQFTKAVACYEMDTRNLYERG